MGICIKCGKQVSSYNPSDLCWSCQEKNIVSMVDSGGPNYTLEDMREILGFQNDTQVKRNWAKCLIPGRIPGIKRYLFHKQTVVEWIKSGGIIPKQPTNPVQQEAYARCKKGDHGWLHDERFEGHAYMSSQSTVEIPDSIFKSGYKRSCYFCGHTEYSPLT